MRRGEIEYAVAGEHHIAYREYVGDLGGDHEIVMVTGLNFPMDSLPEDPIAHRLLEGLASLGRLVVFDRRGIALSDPISDWETPLREQWAADLASVIEAAGCRHPTVFSWHHVGIAQECSVRYPGLIARLVLFNPAGGFTEADAEWMAAWIASTRRLMEGELPEGDEAFLGGRAADPTYRAWSDAAGRVGASPSQAKRIFEKQLVDPSFDNALVAVPTLVITRARSNWIVPPAYLRRIAETFSDAQRVDLGEGAAIPIGDGVDEVVAVISEYLTGAVHLPPPERHLAAILFTDLVDSTGRAAAVGDAAWKRVLDRHDAVSRSEVVRRGGEVVKSTGDGVLAVFPSATAALDAADRIRDALTSEGLEVRIGVHVGEVDRRGDDVSGLAVHLAARVMSAAGAGQVVTTSVVAKLVAGPFTSLGERTLKGIDEPWELFLAESDRST